MSWIRSVIERLNALFRRERVERELDEEIRFHLEREVEKNLARGMDPDEARRTAMVSFGGVERTKEETREERGVSWIDDLRRDLTFAFRTLRRSPGFALVVVLTLGLGIGANTAIFSIIHGVLLKPLPYGDGDRLVHVVQDHADVPPGGRMTFSVHEIRDMRERSRALSQVVEYHGMSFILLGHGEPERVRTGVVSAHFFDVMGMEPALGRGFTEADDAPGAEAVLVLSHGYWQRRFGGDPEVLGRTVEMNDRIHTIVGVLPPVPQYPRENDVYMPTSACPTRSSDGFIANRTARMMTLFGRLGSNVSLEGAHGDVRRVAGEMRSEFPEAYDGLQGHTARVVPLKEELTREARPTLLLLLGTTAFVLLIACANVANLALARAGTRTREMSVRQALGAGRGRLARQLLTESTLLALLGGVVGVGIAYAGLDLLVGFAGRFTPRAFEAGIDVPVLLFALGIAVVTGLVFGSAPALASSDDPGRVLREGAGQTGGRGGNRLQGALVVTQLAVAFVVLVGSGLMLRSFLELEDVDPGFDPRQVLTFQLSMIYPEYSTRAGRTAFFEPLRSRLEAMPDVESVAQATFAPMDGGGRPTSTFELEGRESVASGEPATAEFRTVSQGFFRTLGIPLIAGRGFQSTDDADAPLVGVVNRAFVDRWMPGEDPLGRRMTQCFANGQCNSPMTIVGVVGNVRPHGLAEEAPEEVYRHGEQVGFAGSNILIRTRGEPMSVVSRVKEAVYELDDRVPLSEIQTLDYLVDDSIAPQRLTAILLGIFAAVALAVTLTGIFGVMAFSVGQRTREIGIRMALGAGRRSVLGMVLRKGLVLMVLGLGLGAGAALLASQAIQGLVWGIAVTDALTYLGVGTLLLSVGTLACWIPARRAAAVDPVITFRGG